MGEDAGEHVKRDQSVRIAAFAIDGEGDPDAAEQRFGLGLFETAQFGGHVSLPAL